MPPVPMDALQLRAFCRPPMGVPVSFGGVSTYADDGSPICGLFDRPQSMGLQEQGAGGVVAPASELRLPYNAFDPMPDDGDTVTVAGYDYLCGAPTAEDDGGFLCYALEQP